MAFKKEENTRSTNFFTNCYLQIVVVISDY